MSQNDNLAAVISLPLSSPASPPPLPHSPPTPPSQSWSSSYPRSTNSLLRMATIPAEGSSSSSILDMGQKKSKWNIPSMFCSHQFHLPPRACGMTVDQLPQEFVKVSKHKNTLSFTTADMVRGEEEGEMRARGSGGRKEGCVYRPILNATNQCNLFGRMEGWSKCWREREGTQICCHIIVSCPDVHVPQQRMSGGLIYISCHSGMYNSNLLLCQESN